MLPDFGRARAEIGHELRRLRDRTLNGWRGRGWSSPAPPEVKWAVLERYAIPHACWIETGTYRGDTTKFLSSIAREVISIEPQPELAETARTRLRSLSNVQILTGTSEALFSEVVAGVTGPCCFWLDGHYSSGTTYKGEMDTPVAQELAVIAPSVQRLGRVQVFVDDWRCFRPSSQEYADFPTKTQLVSWADENGLSWTVEHDIFIAGSEPPR